MKAFAKEKIIENLSSLFSSFLEKDHNATICVNHYRIRNFHNMFTSSPLNTLNKNCLEKHIFRVVLTLCQGHKVILRLTYFSL